MTTVTLSSKNQVTLPVKMVRALGLKAGDEIIVELTDGRLVLLPKPANWTEYFKGSLRGVWGASVEEIDRYVAHERRSWERSGPEGVMATVRQDEDMRRIVESLQAAPGHRLPEPDISVSAGMQDRWAPEKLERLVQLGVVDRVREPTRTVYRLREAPIS